MAFVEPDQVGLPAGRGWTEFGCVDKFGHEQGAKLAWRVEEELTGLQERISDLLAAAGCSSRRDVMNVVASAPWPFPIWES